MKLFGYFSRVTGHMMHIAEHTPFDTLYRAECAGTEARKLRDALNGYLEDQHIGMDHHPKSESK